MKNNAKVMWKMERHHKRPPKLYKTTTLDIHNHLLEKHYYVVKFSS
jgi:hypothetical protein